MIGWLLACRSAEDAKLAEQPIEQGELVAVFPPDGAQRLVGDVPVEVVLGAAAEGSTPTVTLTRGDEAIALPCSLGFGGNVADCGAIGGVTGGEALGLTVIAGGTTTEVHTSGALPAQGLGWDLLDGVSFTALGSGSEAVSLANGALGNGHAFAAIDGYDGAAGDWTLIGGESAVQDDGAFGVASPGLAFVLPVTVDADGGLTGSAPTAWLPSQVAAGQVHLLLLDVGLTGTL
ncbi:MAG: hypothetical protein ABMB14_34155, partial [Myxococcota bacterium]